MVDLSPVSFVSIVGAGPGDPELLTLKAVDRLQKADVVLIDALVHPGVLKHCQSSVVVVEVGKRGDKSISTKQETIHEHLLRYSHRGQRIVRLKGGDPSIFARGLEEALFLEEHGVPYEIVPGICSALMTAPAFGIFPTYRTEAQALTILTGHSAKDGEDKLKSVWAEHAPSSSTLIFVMPLKNLSMIVETLIQNGRRQETPAAMMRNASRQDEQCIIGTLATIEAQVKQAELKSPSILFVGDVLKHKACQFIRELVSSPNSSHPKNTETPKVQYV